MQLEYSERVRKANLIDNPLELVPGSENFTKAGVNLTIKSMRSLKLNEETKQWCFDLFEKNMRKIYEKSKSGWDEFSKKEEMFDPKAYYLIAYQQGTDRPMGYSHFRFDMDFDNEVIYCYELQIENEIRRVGLGKFMMEILESLCEKLELEKVMLTVSKYNKVGQKFFKEKMNYELDETDCNDENPSLDYEILSKVFWDEDEESEEEK